MSLLVQALFSPPPTAKAYRNRKYAPNRRTSDARTNGQSRYARDARRAHRHRKRCSAPPSACWYPRSVPAAGRWGNNAYLSSYLCDRARLSSQRFDAILFISQSQSPSQSSHPLPDGRCGLSLPVVSYLPHPCLQRLRRTRYIRRPDAVCRLQWYMPLPVPA